MKAEALLRLNQNNAEATRLINVIRQRGFGNNSHNYTAATLDDLFRREDLNWRGKVPTDKI